MPEVQAMNTGPGSRLVPDCDAEKMTIREAAKLCHRDYDTFLRWVMKGVIPHILVGPYNAKMVFRKDVEALIRFGHVEE